jgi:hypothetical protein
MVWRLARPLIVIAILVCGPGRRVRAGRHSLRHGEGGFDEGGVLPGVTVTALHEASSGNTFVAVTDTVGAFRLPMRTGSYKVTVDFRLRHRRPAASTCCSGRRPPSQLEMSPSTVRNQ